VEKPALKVVLSSTHTCVLRKLWQSGQWPTFAWWQSRRHAHRWHINHMYWFGWLGWLYGNALHYNRIKQTLNEVQDIYLAYSAASNSSTSPLGETLYK